MAVTRFAPCLEFVKLTSAYDLQERKAFVGFRCSSLQVLSFPFAVYFELKSLFVVQIAGGLGFTHMMVHGAGMRFSTTWLV